MEIVNSRFVTSATNIVQADALPSLNQIAFVGRSNVGKSSLINMLTGRKGLAVTSSTPGRTRLINFFEITLRSKIQRQACKCGEPNFYISDSQLYFVDLPGYGFAQASKKMQGGWNQSLTEFLQESKDLKMVFILLDLRHDPTQNDIDALVFLQSNEIPFKILGTKTDKISKTRLHNHVSNVAKVLGITNNDIIVTSANDKRGKREVFHIINSVL